MKEIEKDQIRENVRSNYRQIAIQEVTQGSCCSTQVDCCGGTTDFDKVSAKLGYSIDELSAVPEGANMGLGCGNPQVIADLKLGEVVVDLGSGGGFDCFLASRQVGENGRVIGVDMTPEMISKARLNATKGGFTNTEFRLGEIEHLPVEDSKVDVIISNCVINLSPDKLQVFKEAFRVLKPQGRLAISDIVTTAELPVEMKNDLNLYSGCVSGASSIHDLEVDLKEAGFTKISIEPKNDSKEFLKEWAVGRNIEDYIVSATIQAIKA